MEPVTVNLGIGEAVIVAKDQPEYIPCPAEKVTLGGQTGLITRWRLSQEERDLLMEGADLFLVILTFGNPMQPVKLLVDPKGAVDPPAGTH